jgi:hypothetical protein
MRKAPKGGRLHPVDKQINRIIASLRARVEHPFRVLKCQFGYRRTRYRGLAKNVNVSGKARQCDGAKPSQPGALGVGEMSGRASGRALSESWRVSRRDGPRGPSFGGWYQDLETDLRARLCARR